MKVKIKKYPNFYGSGTLIHKLPISEEWQGRIQEWVPEWYDVLANKLVEWQGGRRTTIHIDHYDTWGMDDTLSHIILPMLKQLNATKQGAPIVDNKDVPKELRSEPVKHDICPTHFDKWDWVLDEMLSNEYIWISQTGITYDSTLGSYVRLYKRSGSTNTLLPSGTCINCLTINEPTPTPTPTPEPTPENPTTEPTPSPAPPKAGSYLLSMNYFVYLIISMSVEITCGKCGEKITNMKMLKSLKDVMNPYDGKCPSCGQKLSTSEFSLDVQEN